jgi:hypothetical protein
VHEGIDGRLDFECPGGFPGGRMLGGEPVHRLEILAAPDHHEPDPRMPLGHRVAIDEPLERQLLVVPASGGDAGSFQSHEEFNLSELSGRSF